MLRLFAILAFFAAGEKPLPAPAGLVDFLGEYGTAPTRVIVFEADQHLRAVVGTASSVDMVAGAKPDEFAVGGKKWVFRRNGAGKIQFVETGTAGVTYERRTDFPEDGAVFRIHLMRPVEELRREAGKRTAPVEKGPFRKADLVDLTTLKAPIHLDIRYATTNNFMGAAMYSQARAFLQRPAADGLAKAALELQKKGFGLLIHDGYRPWYVTWMFWEATPAKQRIFVANPAEGSRHNRGCAVDLSMYEIATGKPVTMPSVYDEMTDRAFPDYVGGTSMQRWNRSVLREAMEKQGFEVFRTEWWHFDFKDWKEYAIGTVRFEDLR